MTYAVSEFRGPYRFLSNFWFCDVRLGGELYPTVEHAFQAAKATDPITRTVIRMACSPSGAKKLGKKVTLRPDWEAEKLYIMEDLLWQKFQDPALGRMLLDTGDAMLVEGNHWGDTYWGVCDGVGENWLGQLLMAVRTRLQGLQKDGL